MNEQSAALLALEKRTRDTIAARMAKAQQQITAQLAVTIDGNDYGSGNEVISDPELHAAIVAALDSAQTDTQQTTRAAYAAAAVIALVALRQQMHDIGHNVTGTLPELGGALAALLAAIAAAFANALPTLQRFIQLNYDAVTDPDTRIVRTNDAVKARFRPLTNSVRASGVVAVYRAATDTQQAVYEQYERINPNVKLYKRWDVTSTNPCATCAALDGTVVGVNEQFPHDSPQNLPVYRDLFGPPRHPNCRCRIIHTL